MTERDPCPLRRTGRGPGTIIGAAALAVAFLFAGPVDRAAANGNRTMSTKPSEAPAPLPPAFRAPGPEVGTGVGRPVSPEWVPPGEAPPPGVPVAPGFVGPRSQDLPPVSDKR